MIVSSPEVLLGSGIEKYIEPAVPTVSESAQIDEVVEALKKSPSRVLYTINPSGALSGVITPGDLAKLNTDPKPTTAQQIATKEKVIGVKPTAELWQLLKIMNGENAAGKNFDQLPVLDQDNKPIGIIIKNALRDTLAAVQIPIS
jgi:CBS domain-containing protein